MNDTENDLMTLLYCDMISWHRHVDMDISKDRERITKEIAKTSDLIHKKYRALKAGKRGHRIGETF